MGKGVTPHRGPLRSDLGVGKQALQALPTYVEGHIPRSMTATITRRPV